LGIRASGLGQAAFGWRPRITPFSGSQAKLLPGGKQSVVIDLTWFGKIILRKYFVKVFVCLQQSLNSYVPLFHFILKNA
jgi:hypothetical protein